MRVNRLRAHIYDPILGRFTSADPFVQYPESTQGLNRYAYVHNNPLSFTDPSGFFLKKIGRQLGRFKRSFRHEIRREGSLLGAVIQVAGAAAGTFVCGGNVGCGAAIAGSVSTGVARAQGITDGDQLLRAGASAAVAAGAFGGLHSWSPVSAAGYVGKTVAHGIVGGVSSEIGGVSFRSGLLSAGFTQAASLSGAFNGLPSGDTLGGKLANGLAAAIVGGTAAEIGGGKFANGAVTGAFSYLFNDADASRARRAWSRSDGKRGDRSAIGLWRQDRLFQGEDHRRQIRFHPGQRLRDGA